MIARRAALVLAAALALAPAPRPAGAAASRSPVASRLPEAHHSVLPFLSNDYSRAAAEARARKVPMFVEAWAPW